MECCGECRFQGIHELVHSTLNAIFNSLFVTVEFQIFFQRKNNFLIDLIPKLFLFQRRKSCIESTNTSLHSFGIVGATVQAIRQPLCCGNIGERLRLWMQMVTIDRTVTNLSNSPE